MNPYSGNSRMGMFRFFILREFFTHQPYDSTVLYGLNHKTADLELIYESNYTAFNQKIFYQLFFDHQLNQYVFNENPELI
jgi:hypothetical protein